jgi:hypothetical protein
MSKQTKSGPSIAWKATIARQEKIIRECTDRGKLPYELKRLKLIRYEYRLWQLSHYLTVNDWRQIRTADYWKEKERIQAQEIPEIDKDIQEREALGLRIAEYLRNFKM